MNTTTEHLDSPGPFASAEYRQAYTKQAQDALEAMIDRGSLAGVLELLETICHEKAEHLRSSWQDDGAARQWEYVARRVATAASAALERIA